MEQIHAHGFHAVAIAADIDVGDTQMHASRRYSAAIWASYGDSRAGALSIGHAGVATCRPAKVLSTWRLAPSIGVYAVDEARHAADGLH